MELQFLHANYTRFRIRADNLTHHQFISQYADAMSISLAVWDNYSKPMDYYEKLSWGGLEISSAYMALKEVEKQAIQKIIQDERFNRSGALGTICNYKYFF